MAFSLRQRIRDKVAVDPTTLADERAFFARHGEWPERYSRRKRKSIREEKPKPEDR